MFYSRNVVFLLQNIVFVAILMNCFKIYLIVSEIVFANHALFLTLNRNLK